MNRLIGGLAVVCVAALAAAQPKGNSVRLGVPLATPSNTVSVAIDGDHPDGARTSHDTAVLDVYLAKLYYDAGEPVVLTTHLHTLGGADLDAGQLDVDDQVTAGPMDEEQQQQARRHGQAVGRGRQQVTLDNRPGEHHLSVFQDTVDAHGDSVHRAVAAYYVVATGELTVLDVGSVHPVGDRLIVELKVHSTGGIFTVSATLASGPIAVAQAATQVTLTPGPATVALPFAQQDIVEPGPYRLVNVTAYGGRGLGLAAAPHDVGRRFQAAHAAHEPAPVRDESGAIVGTGPRPLALPAPAPPPEPAPVVIPEWPQGEPVWPDGSPRTPGEGMVAPGVIVAPPAAPVPQ